MESSGVGWGERLHMMHLLSALSRAFELKGQIVLYVHFTTIENNFFRKDDLGPLHPIRSRET